MYTYTFQVLHMELHVVHIQTKFFWSCLHIKKGWAGLVSSNSDLCLYMDAIVGC